MNATLIRTAANVCTYWRIETDDKRYTVTTYPNSNIIRIETASGRAVSTLVARKLAERIRATIAAVEA